jgi:peptidoglycan/xylan/chitin deacetylase (PgdA/CDA1 family)
MKAYAYQTAKALNADYSLVSISGYGVISGWTGTGVKNEESLILPYYDKIGRSYGRIASQIAPETIPWDFAKFVPDVIVINLGTNDASYCGTDVSRCEEYEAGYVDFIKAVRGYNPNAKIICTLGIMGDSLFPYLESAVKTYQSETKDDNIVTMKFDVQLEADGYAVDYHPSQVTHMKAASKLANFIKAELGLSVNVEENLKNENVIGEDVDTSWIDPSKKLLAVTFDDGPVDWQEDSTAMKILKTFEEYGQRATFFYNGMNINPDNSKEILFAQELGCEIANHTWSHHDMTSLTEIKMKEEVDKTSAVLSKVTGQTTFLLRLPYLSYNDTVLATVDAPCISCCVDTRDYSDEATKESIVKSVLDAHEKGTLANSVILLHEPYEKTQEAVAEIVPKLIEEGYQLVTVSELAATNGVILTSGQVYTKLEKN